MTNRTDRERAAARSIVDRQDTIDGLRDLANLLEDNPELTVSRFQDIYYHVDSAMRGAPEADRVAEVDRVALLLGEKTNRDGTHYRVELYSNGIRFSAWTTVGGAS